MIRAARNYLWLGLLLAFGIGYFTRDRLQTVTVLQPATLAEPRQTPLAKPVPIRFNRNGYRYEATALYDYQISGLIAHKLNYSWFSIDRAEQAFPLDLCLVWGDNLRNRVHQSGSVRFSQDCRWCWAQWQGNVPFRIEQMSNNHLLVDRPELAATLGRLLAGDQVTLRGKLVDVTATRLGKGGRYDSATMTWKTSTCRTDTGAGACEVIYVEQADVLQRANPGPRLLFRASLYGLGILAVWSLADLFRP